MDIRTDGVNIYVKSDETINKFTFGRDLMDKYFKEQN